MEQINVNLIPSGLPPVCHASQYDKGRVIKCNLFEGNTPYSIANGDNITLNARKPDGTIIEGLSPLAIQTGVSYVYITTTEQLCACVGDTLCELRIENSADIGTLNFILRVEADVLADGIPSQSVIKDLNQMVEDAVEDLGVAVIDDTTISVDKTWSSDKIDSLAYDFLIEYDSVTEEFNAGANEILHNLGKGYNIQFKTDATADDFVYILSSIYDYGGDDITLFFDKLIISDNGTGNKPSSILSQAVIVVDAGAETVAFAGFLEQDEIQSTDDSHATQFNTWSAKKIDETIKAAQYSVLPTDTASGSVANFPDGAENVPVESLVVNIEPVQAGTGDPSPSNPRPISGWTACTISHSGADTSDPTEYEIDLDGTVYGGELNVKTGVLTVTHRLVEKTGNDVVSVSQSSSGVYYVSFGTITGSQQTLSANKNEFASNIYEITTGGSTDKACRITTNLLAYNNDITTIEMAQAFYDATHLQIKYPLETIETYQLDPEQINTLYGVNNIWADTGDVTVEYRADIQKYIEKKIAEALNP